MYDPFALNTALQRGNISIAGDFQWAVVGLVVLFCAVSVAFIAIAWRYLRTEGFVPAIDTRTSGTFVVAGIVFLFGLLIAEQLLLGMATALLLVATYAGWRSLQETGQEPYGRMAVVFLALVPAVGGIAFGKMALLGPITGLLIILAYLVWQSPREV